MNSLDSETLQLGDLVVAACELGSRVASDEDVATDLAGRHLARMLAHGANQRLVAQLTVLAREIEPARRPQRSGRSSGQSRSVRKHAA